jgi:Phosphatidylinositol 3- and 4-kinase
MLETRSSWGAPQTLSLRVSASTNDKRANAPCEVGFCWVDLSEQWKLGEASQHANTKRFVADVWSSNASASRFDEHGDLPNDTSNKIGDVQLEVRVTTESIDFDDESNGGRAAAQSRKRMLLYKHDDDLRQEAFAIQFIRTCSDILKASGLDMKLLTFQCIPVGIKRGFVEWVPGSVTLSEICDPFGSILPMKSPVDGRESPQHSNKAGLSKYGSLRRLSGQQNESLRLLATSRMTGARGSIANDPIQDYLRSVAFDPKAPYFIRRDVMDTYVKSCAGYGVITYVLGVGDRHLDNLLLHQSGSFFHCDFSFILGSDPKTYLPMRMTEDMVYGMGGRESDNYARFLSLAAASFLALRRPENVRILLSMVRLMKPSCLPDVSENQSTEQAINGVRDRLRLDLSESRAIVFMEELVEASLSNKIWIAVDAIHQLGKSF